MRLYEGNPLGALVTFVISESIRGKNPSILLYFSGEMFGCSVHIQGGKN